MNINDTLKYQNIGLPDDIRRCQLRGDYAEAIRLIDYRLEQPNIPQSMRYSLQIHRQMFLRTPEYFPHTLEQGLDIVRQDIPDFTMEELQSLMDQRYIRWIYIDGEKKLIRNFYSSICKSVPGFALRAQKTLSGAESAVQGSVQAQQRDICMQKMKERGSLTNRIRIRTSVKLNDDQFTPGMFIRAHLPIPSQCEQQSDIVIEKMYPETGQIAPIDAPQRTICWEETMEENHEFMVEYSYLHKAVFHDTEHMGPSDEIQPDFYTQGEAPHIVFTPYIKELVKTLTEGVTDPLEKARIFYDFITLNMKYTFMPAYFGLENIAETCARSYTGDCGVFALLFITLCRCAGIPACWQSGLTAEPDFCGGHDWARFYVAPYGWLFADTSYGTGAVRLEKEERRKFYFGNLDPFRMVANSEFMAPFTVDKDHWRADPYDNQIGEIETTDRGLCYDEYVRDKVVILCEEVSI